MVPRKTLHAAKRKRWLGERWLGKEERERERESNYAVTQATVVVAAVAFGYTGGQQHCGSGESQGGAMRTYIVQKGANDRFKFAYSSATLPLVQIKCCPTFLCVQVAGQKRYRKDDTNSCTLSWNAEEHILYLSNNKTRKSILLSLLYRCCKR